jgi:tetratricopeptide (TPR) repeat protein
MKNIVLIKFISVLIICTFFIQCSDKPADDDKIKYSGESIRQMNTDEELLVLGRKYYSDKDNEAYAINYAEALIKNRYYAAALKLLEEISGKFPEDTKVHELYKDALIGEYRYQEYSESDDTLLTIFSAISELDQQIQTERSDAGLFNKRGILFLQMNNLNAAEFDFKRACQIDCTFYNSFYNSIYIRYLMDKNSEALDLIINKEKNIRYQNISEKQTILNLRKVLIDLNTIENNLSLDEKNKSLEKSKIYVKLKDYNLALNKLNSAISADQNFGNAYALRAMVYYYLNQKGEALKDLEMAEKLTGNYNTLLSKMIRGS